MLPPATGHPYPYDDLPGDTVGPAGDLRASDSDRNDVIERLQRHAADGRLSLDEFEARLAEVYEAKTGNELRQTLRELPPEPPGAYRPRGPGGRRGFAGHGVRPARWPGHGAPWARRGPRWGFPPVFAVVALAALIVLLTPAPFPLIPIAFWSAILFTVLHRRRRYHERVWHL